MTPNSDVPNGGITTKRTFTSSLPLTHHDKGAVEAVQNAPDGYVVTVGGLLGKLS